MTVIEIFDSYSAALARARELALSDYGIQNIGDIFHPRLVLARMP